MGWLGMADDVVYTLGVIGADRDEDGRFVVTRGGVASFMGAGEEVCISDDASYFVDGDPKPLAALMNDTSYGVRNVTVTFGTEAVDAELRDGQDGNPSVEQDLTPDHWNSHQTGAQSEADRGGATLGCG